MVNHKHQRRDQKSAQAVNFQLIAREMCTPGWAKDQVPDSDVVLFFRKYKPVSQRWTTSNCSKAQNPQHYRGVCDTSTRAVACAVASQPQPLPCAHPPVLSHGHTKLLTDCGDDHLSNSLLLSLSALLFWRSSDSDDAWSPERESTPILR